MTNERHEKALEAAEWIKHETDRMPVPATTVVDVVSERGRTETAMPAGMLYWGKGSARDYIVGYRIHTPNHFTNGE